MQTKKHSVKKKMKILIFIVDISYGRGVGYTFTEHDLGADIHKISATDIRKKLKQKGEL